MQLSRLLLAAAAGLIVSPAVAADGAPGPGGVPVADNPAAAAAPAAGDAANADADLRRQASYAIGTDVAQKVGVLIEQMALDKDALMKGLGDVLDGKVPAISSETTAAIMLRYQEKQKNDLAKNAAQKALKREETNAAFLDKNSRRTGVKTTTSGLQYEVLTVGAGVTPKMGDQVSVNYKGSLIDGTFFDSSERHGGASTFVIGQVIRGWNEALQMMKEGDTWKLTIPAELAYGKSGPASIGPARVQFFDIEQIGEPPSIGPNQVLIFEVELLKVIPKS